MPRVVRGGLIQATLCESATAPVAKIKQAMLDKHVALIAEAAERGAQVVCLQELFYGPYFCAEQQRRWYDLTERIPDGPTTRLMAELAKKYSLVLVVPLYEEDLPGVYYNSAAVLDAVALRSLRDEEPDDRLADRQADRAHHVSLTQAWAGSKVTRHARSAPGPAITLR